MVSADRRHQGGFPEAFLQRGYDVQIFPTTEAKPQGDDHFRRDAFVLRQPVQGRGLSTGATERHRKAFIYCQDQARTP